MDWGRCMCCSPCRYSAVPIYKLCTKGCLWDHHSAPWDDQSLSLPPHLSLFLSFSLLKPHFKDHGFVILFYLDRWASPLYPPSSWSGPHTSSCKTEGLGCLARTGFPNSWWCWHFFIPWDSCSHFISASRVFPLLIRAALHLKVCFRIFFQHISTFYWG